VKVIIVGGVAGGASCAARMMSKTLGDALSREAHNAEIMAKDMCR